MFKVAFKQMSRRDTFLFLKYNATDSTEFVLKIRRESQVSIRFLPGESDSTTGERDSSTLSEH